jgi:hypothetical protein
MQDSSALSSGSEAAADFRGGTIIARPHNGRPEGHGRIAGR